MNYGGSTDEVESIRIIHAATGEILRDLTLDPTRSYQGTGAPKGPTRPKTKPSEPG